MTTSVQTDPIDFEVDGNMRSAWLFAQLFSAYLDSSDNIQVSVRNMVDILKDPKSTSQNRQMALSTITALLFPQRRDGDIGSNIDDITIMEMQTSRRTADTLRKMHDEQLTFAQRVERLMDEQNLNQSQLAERIGVKQPAISMILSRKSRPQRRTVIKIAKALDVAPEELWPELRNA